jgi:hypothetical protein
LYCGLLGDPENGGNIFLWNVGNHLQDYTASRPKFHRRQYLKSHTGRGFNGK